MKQLIRFLIFLALPLPAVADPLLTSWFTLHPDQSARLYQTDDDRRAGRAVETWGNGRLTQAQPARTGIQQILFSTNWVYIRSIGLPTQVLGPYYLDERHERDFPNIPVAQNILLCLPRQPVVETEREYDHLGDIGLTVDGVPIFDPTDSFSYSHANAMDASPRAGIGRGDGVWDRDAMVNEGVTFDPGLGHPQERGRYHYHAEAVALRYALGDHMDFDPVTKYYHESAGEPTRHSPILGWLHDGSPVYGPYGYANPSNAASGLRRMISGYGLRDGRNRTDNLNVSGRNSLPAWAGRASRRSTQLEPGETGPRVSARFPLGHFLQDYTYLGDGGREQGKDFDLDEHNGRWCVTPEFPQGTYAYFITIDAAGKPSYPYVVGKTFHGHPYGRVIRSIRERVVTYFDATSGAGEKKAAMNAGPGTTTLVWQPQEGGGYQTRETR